MSRKWRMSVGLGWQRSWKGPQVLVGPCIPRSTPGRSLDRQNLHQNVPHLVDGGFEVALRDSGDTGTRPPDQRAHRSISTGCCRGGSSGNCLIGD